MFPERYPYKHYDSVFTRFYQGYLLPEKFRVDKRRTHLSTLIASGQMSRSEAITLLTTPPYPQASDLEVDLKFVLQKMRWTRQDLDDYLQRSRREHVAYPSENWMRMRMQQLANATRKRFP